MISPVDEGMIESLRIFGSETGMAFQIVDDILDFNGDQTTVGKPLGSDLLQGLVTLPAIYYAEVNPDDPDVKVLAEGGWSNQERMERLVDSIRRSQAIEQSLQEAQAFIGRALNALAPIQPGGEKTALEELARYLVDRKI
jgi:geranylgeranyl pyrophosphate synthase